MAQNRVIAHAVREFHLVGILAFRHDPETEVAVRHNAHQHVGWLVLDDGYEMHVVMLHSRGCALGGVEWHTERRFFLHQITDTHIVPRSSFSTPRHPSTQRTCRGRSRRNVRIPQRAASSPLRVLFALAAAVLVQFSGSAGAWVIRLRHTNHLLILNFANQGALTVPCFSRLLVRPWPV